MLTGDKLETAENIGYSCKLLTQEMIVWRIASPSDVLEVCSQERVNLNIELQKKQQKRGLLVEASSLTLILSSI